MLCPNMFSTKESQEKNIYLKLSVADCIDMIKYWALESIRAAVFLRAPHVYAWI